MKHIFRFLLCMLITVYGGYFLHADTTVDFRLFTSSYAYNGENTLWQDTRTTLTYFENFTEGAFDIKFNDFISLRVGASVFFPFTFEFPQGIRVFPIVTTQLSNEYISFLLLNNKTKQILNNKILLIHTIINICLFFISHL